MYGTNNMIQLRHRNQNRPSKRVVQHSILLLQLSNEGLRDENFSRADEKRLWFRWHPRNDCNYLDYCAIVCADWVRWNVSHELLDHKSTINKTEHQRRGERDETSIPGLPTAWTGTQLPQFYRQSCPKSNLWHFAEFWIEAVEVEFRKRTSWR